MRRFGLSILAAAIAAAVPLAGPDLNAALCDGISPTAETPLTAARVASGLLRPLFVAAPPGDTSRIFIVQQDGLIKILKDGVLRTTPFLDVSTGIRSPANNGGQNEEGLLGLAFHPDYATNGWFFIYHTNTTGSSNILARYTRSATDPDQADLATRQVVISFAHTMAANHNGGMIAFGPTDGLLYIATGDGGTFCDTPGNAQSGTVNLGKILRIDVDTLPFSIPPGNPFTGPDGVNDVIWALGLRNPWRFSFDRQTSDLYIADVGQGSREEIDLQLSISSGGENYGWPNYEGTLCPNPTCGSATCSIPALELPILEYPHGAGVCAVTGGYVYRGCRMPGLHGRYFYADFCEAFVKSFVVSGGGVTGEVDHTAEIAPGGGLSISSITSFGEDARGEIYIVDRGGTTGGGTGEIFKILPILPNMEVSGPGAEPVAYDSSGLTWEDLKSTSMHAVATYRVYRDAAPGDGTFTCVHEGATPGWAGADPTLLPPGGGFAYLVTAVNSAGTETSPGTGTGGLPRDLSPLACPP